MTLSLSLSLTHTRARARIYIHTRTHTNTHARTQTHTHAPTHTRTHALTHARTHAHTHTQFSFPQHSSSPLSFSTTHLLSLALSVSLSVVSLFFVVAVQSPTGLCVWIFINESVRFCAHQIQGCKKQRKRRNPIFRLFPLPLCSR